MTGQIRGGDTVRHGPTGETWVVACVEGEDLAWCGWPPGLTRLADCTLLAAEVAQERLLQLDQAWRRARERHSDEEEQ